MAIDENGNVIDENDEVIADDVEGDEGETETIFVTPDEIKVQEEQAAQTKASDDDEDVPEEYRGRTKRQIIDAMLARASESNIGQQFREGIEALGDRIAPPPVQQDQPFVLDAKRRAEINEKLKSGLYGDDPLAVIQEAIFPTVAPYLAEGAMRTVKQAREIVKLSPDTGDTFKKYEKEIDEWVNGRPQTERLDPTIWERGLSEIRQRHFTDIVKEQATAIAKQIAEEQIAKLKSNATKVTVPNTDTSSGAAGGATIPAKKQQRVIIRDLARAKELAFSEGSVEMKKVKKGGKTEYEVVDQAAFLEFCEERGFKA